MIKRHPLSLESLFALGTLAHKMVLIIWLNFWLVNKNKITINYGNDIYIFGHISKSRNCPNSTGLNPSQVKWMDPPGCSRRGSPRGSSPAIHRRYRSSRRTRQQSRSWRLERPAHPESPGSHTALQWCSHTWSKAESQWSELPWEMYGHLFL